MNRNIYIPDDDAEVVETFMHMFHRSASTMLVKFMKETVEKLGKYKNELTIGHANKDNSTTIPIVFYGQEVANGEWLLPKKVLVTCKIFLTFSGAYLVAWRCKPEDNTEYSYWDYRIIEKPASELAISFSNEKPSAWKLAGYKNIPRNIQIPENMLALAQTNADLILEHHRDWPILRPPATQSLQESPKPNASAGGQQHGRTSSSD